ncbi:hypothetical protein BGZ97_009549 [Linnemannia gamsii]|uniref:BTB domain-containing protein n=1 Tax=Linnemannia gamsii TaxID=64522 RepID=A0A9P6QNE9_9FUNG|nr:hypothetical protein BGZ97_009549 [Linnemannia gamsii]
MTQVTSSVRMTHEVTLRIVSPLLDNTNKSVNIQSPVGDHGSHWRVCLDHRSDSILIVYLTWIASSNNSFPGYTSMHIFSHGDDKLVSHTTINGASLKAGHNVPCNLPAEKVTKDGKYDFDVVLCTDLNLPRTLLLSTATLPLSTAPVPVGSSPKNNDVLPLLLKDANSVDVCFIFTSDKAYSNVGLWAHRVVLSRHNAFQQLLLKQAEVQSLANMAEDGDDKAVKVEYDAESICTTSADSDPTTSPTTVSLGETRVMVVKVDKFSLATFCALLYYIYTDEVELTIDTGHFAISSGEGSLVWRDITTGKVSDSIRWHPTDRASPWKLKDVTWNELLEAADHYGILDLRANCLEKVISGMNQSNAVGMLFNKAVSGSEVRQAAMEFIVEHWGSIFQKGSNTVDHFAAYRGYPECHDVLIELMQMKADMA